MRQVLTLAAVVYLVHTVCADPIAVPIRKRIHKPITTDATDPTDASSKAISPVNLGTANIVYFAEMAVGTPPVEFLVLLDTGSADLVLETAIQADSCSGCQTVGPLYNASSSSSSQVTDTPITLTYAIGENSGVIASDLVSFGGFTLNQTFAACDINSKFTNVPSITGLLGLGLVELAESQAVPFVEQLYRSGQLDAPEFGMGFAPGTENYADEELIAGGYLTLGGTNATLYEGDIKWYNVPNSTFGRWYLPVDYLSIGNSQSSTGTTAALIDSGTNGIYVPNELAASIYTALGGSYSSQIGGYTYPCSANPVSLSFTINNDNYTMDPAAFLVSQSSNGICTGAVLPTGSSSAESNLWILGSPFMNTFYSAFRFSPLQIGLAPIANISALQAADVPTISTSAVPLGSATARRTSATRIATGRTSGAATPTASPTGAASMVQAGGKLAALVPVVMAILFSLV